MTKILSIAAVALLTLGSFSCSKKSDNGGSNNTTKGKSVLIKITLSPAVLPGQDDISGAVNGVLPGSQLATWKVNGVTRTNESTISFTQADFKSGVITIEATAGVTSANLALSGLAVNQTSYSVLVETTLDGKAQDPVTIPVTSVLQRSFSYF